MKLKNGKRVVALMLSAVLTICGIQFPATETRAEGTGPACTIIEGSEETSAQTWMYGTTDLDGEDFAPTEITNTKEIGWFTNTDGNFEVTMVLRFNQTGLSKGTALFTLENPTDLYEGKSKYITAFYIPNSGIVSIVNHETETGIRWTVNDLRITDTKYHKLSFSFSGKKFNASLDGTKKMTELNGNNQSTWKFDKIVDFLSNSSGTTTKFYIGKKAPNGKYKFDGFSNNGIPFDVHDLDGYIKYAEFSKNTFDATTLLNHNAEVNSTLSSSNAFDSYVSSQEGKTEADYTSETWEPFKTALQAAQNAEKEQEIYNTYNDLKTAVAGLRLLNNNRAPEEKSSPVTLVKGRTLTLSADDLATDPDGDNMTITALKKSDEKLNCSLGSDGRLQISCEADAEVGEESAEVTVTVTDAFNASIDVTFGVEFEETLKLEYDLREHTFNPKDNPGAEIYKADANDARILRQAKDSLEISMTLRFDANKGYHTNDTSNYFYLMEIGSSKNNYSVSDTNSTPSDLAASTMSLILDLSNTRICFNSGAIVGSSRWTTSTGGTINDGKMHTLTFSLTADGMKLYVDDKALTQASGDAGTTNFMQAFFGGTPASAFYQDWRGDIDTITIGDCYEFSVGRHPNYGRFGGEIKSVVISDGTYSQENLLAHHKSYGIEIAKNDLQTAVDAMNTEAENSLQDSQVEFFKHTALYQKAENILNGTVAPEYAAEIYNIITDLEVMLEAYIANPDNIGLTDIGGGISAMFNNDADNSWIFGGGVETQGRFSEIRGVRNYIGHFEELIRWDNGANNAILKMQRYTINVGKTDDDAVAFAGKLKDYIAELDPKAVAYLVGPEDYKKGEEGIEDFKEALTFILQESLAMKEGKGFAVIQLPHVVNDAGQLALAKKYVRAAKEAMRAYVLEHQDQKDRIVMVDHMELSDTDVFKSTCLTGDGLLNADGHFEIAKELKEKTYGASGSLQAITRRTEEDAPESYENKRPAVTAQAGGKLKVVIPEGVPADKTNWDYTVQIGTMEINGSAVEAGEERSFTIDELPEDEDYILTLKSSDNALQLAKAYGKLAAGNESGAAELTALQQKIREKVDDTEKPLTWLFMGDSITHGASHMKGYDSISQIFEKYLKDDLGRTDDIVINTGVSGATAATIKENIEQRLTKYMPDIVSVMIGTNDTGNGAASAATSQTRNEYMKNLEFIVEKIRETNPNALIIFRTPTPANPSSHANRIKHLEHWMLDSMRSVAERDGNILFIDQYTDWNKELNTFSYLRGDQYYYSDSLHPNPVGQLRMAQQFIRECGLNTDTRIANLSYQLGFTDRTDATVPSFTAGRIRIALEKTEIERLQTASGKTFGAFEVTVTDAETGRTYTKSAYAADERIIVRYLPNGGQVKTYQVSVTGIAAGSAEKVKFADASVTLSPDQDPLPYYVFLDRPYIREVSEGAVAARVYMGIAAPEGESHFELVADDEGNKYDNDLFVIDGDTLKIGQALKRNASYTVCIQSVQDDENNVHSQKAVYELKTIPTLEALRRDAALSLESEDDRMALDLDLAGHSFEEDGYLDLGAADSQWYGERKYLDVLNNLREKTDGGTIIFRFRTTGDKGLIFGSGSTASLDATTMAFGLSSGELRGKFRTLDADGLRGNFHSEIKLNDGNWHTVALSFDTTKTDFQNQALLSIDGHENIYDTSWWTKSFRTWFNQSKDKPVTRFVVGGDNINNYKSEFGGSDFTSGNIAFVTITDQIYTEEELKLLTHTDWIEGEQALRLDGSNVIVPEGAAYTASPVVWDEDNAEAEFTLSANDGALFRDNEVSVSIVNGATLGSIDNVQLQYAEDSRSVNVRFSVSQWREHAVFEGEEITVTNGVSDDVSEILNDETIEKLNAMRRGSVTVRFKMDEATAEADGRRVLFSVSNGKLNGYSAFYVTPSTGAVGYSIRNQVSNASVTINTDEAARENIKNQNWHTVTYVFNTSGTEIYMDGMRVLVNKEVGFLRNTENVKYARIGSVYRGESQPNAFAFGGEINYIQVTYDVLDESEIKALHAATAPKALALPEDAVKTADINLYEEGYDESPFYEMPSLLAISGDPESAIIAAADKRQTTEADRGNIDTVIRRSTNNGKTWSEPQTVFNQPEGSVMSSFTTAPTLVEGQDGRIHMIVNLFPESQGRLSTGLIEKGSGFKKVGDKLYPILRNYGNTALNAEDSWTKEYTIRENGIVYEEMDDGAQRTDYRVPNYLATNGGGDLFKGDEQEPCGNIYVYTGENAGELKVPRVMSVVTCYSDNKGENWKGYQNITGMIKEEWMKFIQVGSGAGIRLEHQTNPELNGRIVVPVCYTNGDSIHSYAAALIYSDDNGVTWKRTDTPVALEEGIDVTKDTFKDYSLRESSVVELGDGTLKMFSSNYSGRLKMSTGAFGEDGFAWTDVQEAAISDQGENISVLHMNGTVDGKETILLLAPLGPGSNNGYIHMGLYQEDGTFEWKYLRKIKADDFGNSCISMLDNGSVGILFKGSDQDITFTSMNEKWLTSPRYADFEKPVIEEVTMKRDGSVATFTVSLDSALMKKGDPVLKLKVKEAGDNAEAADAQAAYVSRRGLKEYVFSYDMGQKELDSITAVNIAMSGAEGFIEGVTGLLPEDVAFSFNMGRDGVIAEMQDALEDLKELYGSDGSEYEEEYWEAFQEAYDKVKEAYDASATSGATASELSKLLSDLQNAKNDLDSHRVPEPDQERDGVIAEMQNALKNLKELYDSDGSEYEEEYWEAFQEAYDKVKEAYDASATSEATASQLSSLLTDLQNAKTDLDSHRVPEPGPDRETVIGEINQALKDLKDLYEAGGTGYDKEVWEAFEAAYKDVENALKDAETSGISASQLSALLGKLKEAKQGMDDNKTQDSETVKAQQAVKKALDDYKNTFDKLKANYTDATWRIFEAAYKAAQKAMQDGVADKKELERLEKELKEAFGKLAKVQNDNKAQKLAAPAITSLKAVAEKKLMGVKIQVGKVANADIYTVYRAIGSSVKEIGRVNASGVVYDQSPVGKKVLSYYAVAESSSGKYLKSDKGASKTVKLDASVKKITVKQVGKKTQARLSWKKVKNAKQYIVYRSMKKDSGYTKIKALKKNAKNYVDKKVKKGKTYYYRIIVKTKKGFSAVTTSKKLKIKK